MGFKNGGSLFGGKFEPPEATGRRLRVLKMGGRFLEGNLNRQRLLEDVYGF